MSKLLIVSGPTASGKSDLAHYLCDRFGGVIVSVDSMQIYKGLDIGTAKPTKEEISRYGYRMVDIVSPETPFSCAEFTEMATKEINDIISSGRLPILSGGTGLYIENIINPTEFSECGGDENIRAELEALGSSELHEMLRACDPESADAIHPNNRKRVIRAIEIYKLTGVTKTEFDKRSRQKPSPYDLCHITLVSENREVLYERINRRVDIMMDKGLLDEAKSIDFDLCPTAAQAIGYKELIPYLRGECSLGESVDKLKQSTRNYAKRQLTWFARYTDALRLDISLFSKDEMYEKAAAAAARLCSAE